jgi:hypothetical protein
MGASNDKFKIGPRCFVGLDGRAERFLSFLRTIALFLAGTTGSGLPVPEERFFFFAGVFFAGRFADFFAVLVLFGIRKLVQHRC